MASARPSACGRSYTITGERSHMRATSRFSAVATDGNAARTKSNGRDLLMRFRPDYNAQTPTLNARGRRGILLTQRKDEWHGARERSSDGDRNMRARSIESVRPGQYFAGACL